MKRLIWITSAVCLCALIGCDSPSPRFAAFPPKQVTLGGSTFSIRHTEYEAEVIRTNYEPGATRTAIFQKAVAAIRQSSACDVVPGSLRGDANVVRADLKCSGADEALRPPKRTSLDCIGYEDQVWDGLYEIECDVVRD